MATVPLIEAADCTNSGNNSGTSSWAVSYPAYSAGDLLIFHIASDANVTHNWSATGPNSETVVDISDSAGGTAQRASAFYYIAAGAQSAGTFTVTPSASEQWTATVVRVPAGEFDAADPIEIGATTNVTTGTPSTATPSWTCTKADARVVVWFAMDVVQLTSVASGWTLTASVDRGATGGSLTTRDAGTTASETIASVNHTKSTNETHTAIGYVINAPVDAGTIGTPVNVGVDVSGSNSSSVAATGLTSGHRLFAFAAARRQTSLPGKPSISDTQSLTWEEVVDSDVSYEPAGDPKVWCVLYTAITNGSNTTISSTSTDAARMALVVISMEGAGVPTNVATGTSDSGDPSATMSAVASGSAGVGFLFGGLNNNPDVPTGYTELLDEGQASGATCRTQVIYDMTSPATTAAWSTSLSSTVGLLMEVPEPAAAALDVSVEAGSYALTGTAALLEHGREVAAAAGSYALSGSVAALEIGREVGAAAGSYAIAGTAAGLLWAHELGAAAGSYALTGTAAALEFGFEIGAAGSSYALTGDDVTLTIDAADPRISAEAGSYALTGTVAGLLATWEIEAAAGAYALTGTAASVEYGREAVAGAGSYSLTGTAADLVKNLPLVAGVGSYALTGTDVLLITPLSVEAVSGGYALAGTAASLEVAREVAAASGSYALTGGDVQFGIGIDIEALGGVYALTGTVAVLIDSTPPSFAPLLPFPTYQKWVDAQGKLTPEAREYQRKRDAIITANRAAAANLATRVTQLET